MLGGIAAVVLCGLAASIYWYEHTAATIAKVPHAVSEAADVVKDANANVTDALRSIGTTSQNASVSAMGD